jgi:enamine deaminase RidA (YjgF/YER057c/UK114 family)
MDWKVEDVYSKVISPAAHYTMGRRAGPLFFLAGQIAAIPEENKIIKGYQDLPKEAADMLKTGSMNADMVEGHLVAQSWFIWNNIQKMLQELGSDLDQIMFVTTYIRNMDFFPALARVRKMFFDKGGKTYPPGTILEVPRLGLSLDILIEIEIVAIIPPK